MVQQLLLLGQVLVVALVYLFVWRVLRAARTDLHGAGAMDLRALVDGDADPSRVAAMLAGRDPDAGLNDILALLGGGESDPFDDPAVQGIACYFTVPEKGGLKGAFGLAEQTSDVSLACRQVGPVKFLEKSDQGGVAFKERRSLFFKTMQIVRGCDAKRNTIVYMAYSDKLIDGSPKNSTSAVPIQPWGTATDVPRCSDWIKG